MLLIKRLNAENRQQFTKTVVSALECVPTPMGGLALSIASLGGAWAFVAPELGSQLKVTTALIAAVLILSIIVKFILHPKYFIQELAHPVVGSVMPTCAMATMVVASSLLPYLGEVARGLWLVAVCCHIMLFIGFMYYRMKYFQLDHVMPSWFIPSVGIIVAAVSSEGMGYDILTHSCFIFGLVFYFIKLPIMLYRLIFRDTLPTGALPTFAIMAAPASLSLAGYLTISSNPDPLLVLILAPLAVFMTSLVYIAFIRLLQLPFSPGYAAFTFPMVIGAVALMKLTVWLQTTQYTWLAGITGDLGYIELIVATMIVSYVAMHYLFSYLFKANA